MSHITPLPRDTISICISSRKEWLSLNHERKWHISNSTTHEFRACFIFSLIHNVCPIIKSSTTGMSDYTPCLSFFPSNFYSFVFEVLLGTNPQFLCSYRVTSVYISPCCRRENVLGNKFIVILFLWLRADSETMYLGEVKPYYLVIFGLWNDVPKQANYLES